MYLLFFCVLFFFLVFFFCFDISFFFFDWRFIVFKLNFYFNSLIFSFVLFLVALTVLIFSCYYLVGELNFGYYCYVLIIFIFRIFFLNFCDNVFIIILRWDLLGISSFFLVLFYNNWDRATGSMNTVLTNRVGDYFIFIFFSSCLFSSYHFFCLGYFCDLIFLFLVFISFTKSAQYPFSRWLPKAIRAPTPVRSIVHRSTLVTAGLILIINFNFIIYNVFLIIFILVFGVFTIFFSRITALLEEDMKKLVALRTLSQMGFSFFTFGLGLNYLSFIHLISHALFKSCLFIQVGYIIHCSYGQQDSRFYGNNGNLPYFMQLQFRVTLFCLCGLFFSRGMVSKDFILEFFFFNFFSIFLTFLFFFSIFLTFLYSYRLWSGFFLRFNQTLGYIRGSYFFSFLRIFLVCFSVFFIWWLNFNFILVPSLFLYLDFFFPLFCFFLVFVVIFFFFNFFFKVFFFKFFVDYYNFFVCFFLPNYKFFDIFLNKLNFFGYRIFLYGGHFLNLYLKNINYNVMIFVVFFIVFFIYKRVTFI